MFRLTLLTALTMTISCNKDEPVCDCPDDDNPPGSTDTVGSDSPIFDTEADADVDADSDADADADGDLGVSFDDVQFVFDTNCISSGCHDAASAAEGLVLQAPDTFDNLLASSTQASMPRVYPGDLNVSYLLYKLKGTQAEVKGYGSQMPQGGKLSSPDIQLIERWILEGANPPAPGGGAPKGTPP